MAYLHQRGIRTALAPRWAGNLLSLREPKSHGSVGGRWSDVRTSGDSVPNASSCGRQSQPYALCPARDGKRFLVNTHIGDLSVANCQMGPNVGFEWLVRLPRCGTSSSFMYVFREKSHT